LQPPGLDEIAALEGGAQPRVQRRREVVGRADAAQRAGREAAEQRLVDAPRQIEAIAGDIERAAIRRDRGS
jgi:hypothetical protein